jgi:hypothetical protein
VDAKTTFVNQTVMMAAEQHQVFHCCFTTIGPVPNVVCVDKVRMGATGETASAVTPLQSAANGRWNGAAFAPDVQWFAIRFIQPVH